MNTTLRILASFLCLPLAASCVTSGQLARVEAKVDAAVADGIVTEEEGADIRAEIASVAKEVEDATTGTLEDLAATGGLTGLLTAFGLNLYRNSRRRARGEPVTVPPQT